MNRDNSNYRSVLSLGDSVPLQVKPERGSPFDTQKSFQAWLGGLPLANVSAVSNELVAGLQELNRSRVPVRFRLKVLRELLEPIRTEGELLDKQYSDTTFPLQEQIDRHGRIALQFYRELAVGYRIATDELAGGSSSVGVLTRGKAAQSVHCALCCHEQYLLRLALLYQEMPVGVWNEIHSLYAFAQQNDLQDKTCRELFTQGKTRLEDVYKRLCLLGVSDLCRLGQRSIRRVFDAAPIWSNRLRLLSGGAREGLFEINPHGDNPPQLILPETDAQSGMMLDVGVLRDWLEPLVKSGTGRMIDTPFKRASGPSVVIDNLTLKQVLSAWGSRIERSFKRLPADHEIKMNVGINGIHYMVAGEIGLSQFIDDIDDVNFFTSASSNQNWIAAADDRYRPIEFQASVVNQSVGGYRLRLTEMSGLHLRVGEIVSLCASSIANRDTTWLMGLVRWMHAISTQEMEVGVVVIGHAVRAAAVLLEENGEERSMPPFRGLIIDGFSPGTENLEHLLVPGFVSDAGAVKLAYREDGKIVSRQVMLASLEDRTTEVSRFSFADVPEADQETASEIAGISAATL